MALAPGSTIGPFRVIELLGKGGMASVYKAYQARLGRHVALKVLPQEFLHDDNFAKRFEREARIVARLEHPHIVPIYDYGIDDDIPWMSMWLLPVGSVADLLAAQGRLSADRVGAILRQVAEALGAAHELGIIHRDIKPGNILLDSEDQVYVGDFGIAHLADASVELTRSGMMAGTPQYMAPEQALSMRRRPPCRYLCARRRGVRDASRGVAVQGEHARRRDDEACQGQGADPAVEPSTQRD